MTEPIDLAAAGTTVRLENGFLAVVVDVARPRVTSLRVDPQGRGAYSPNQLATGLAASSRVGPRARPANGALTQYVDHAGNLHSSSQSTGHRVEPARLPTTGLVADPNPFAVVTELTIAEIAYGARRERWTIALADAEPAWSWKIDTIWTDDVDVLDCRTPAFWFAQRDDWGEPVHLQFLERALDFTDPFGSARAVLVSGGLPASRAMTTHAKAAVTVKLYARSSDVDLALSSEGRLQRGWWLNAWTFVGRSSVPAGGEARSIGTEETGRLEMRLLDPGATGAQLDLEPREQPTVRAARRLFRTHANCALLADGRDGRTGNESDGYHAAMMTWVHALGFGFAHDRDDPGRGRWTARSLFAAQLRHLAAATDAEGRVRAGYAAGTALDVGPSFVLAAVEHLRRTQDRALADELAEPLVAVIAQCRRQAERGDGLLSVTAPIGPHGGAVQPAHVIDYWDWSRRRGAVTYPNLLLLAALRAMHDLHRWREEPAAADEMAEAADALQIRIRSLLWDDDLGAFAEAADGAARSSHLYTAVQYLAVTTGVVTGATAIELVTRIEDRLRELGPEWDAFGVPTNLYDAAASMPDFPAPADSVVAFGHTMNGGRLLSWTYFQVAALVATGRAELAWQRLAAVLDRFERTALLEGVNYWDHRGRPDRARLEPYLADVFVLAAAIPRWFLGVRPDFDGLHVDPRPVAALPSGAVTFDYRGDTVRLAVDGWPDAPAVSLDGGDPAWLRLYRDGRPLSGGVVRVNGRPAVLDDTGRVR